MYGKYSNEYDKWCECYDINNEELIIIEKHIQIMDMVILDIGCGTGRLSIKLASEAKHVFAVDIDEDSTYVLKRKLNKLKMKNIEVITNDITCVEFPHESLDIVVFSWSFYSLPKDSIQTILSKIQKWLKSNGKLLILQPDSGEFEEVMRSVFIENQGHEEYLNSYETMELIENAQIKKMDEFEIRLNFEFTDLDFGVNAIKMFAVTEGEYKGDPALIPDKPIIAQFMKYFNGKKYILNDLVRGFIFKKVYSFLN